MMREGMQCNPGCLWENGSVGIDTETDWHYAVNTYQIFPGITFSFVDAHGQQVRLPEKNTDAGHMIEITHCREDRLECNLNGEFAFLSPGDLMIVRSDTVSPSLFFPIKHYHGLTVQVDLAKTPHCLSCILDDVKVQPQTLMDKFCKDNAGYIARANPSFAHIFSEVYSVPEKIRTGYFKIKALELLLFLSELNLEDGAVSKRLYTKSGVALAKRIGQYLSTHMAKNMILL